MCLLLALTIAVSFAPGMQRNSAAAAPSVQDASLTADPRFTHVQAAPQNGSGTDQGTFLPPLANQGVITGTVLASEAGPTAFYIATVTSNGDQQIYKGKTDEHGHFHLRIPAIAGLASLLLFKEFDSQGHPDKGATCQISKQPAHLENTEPVVNVPANGPAIVEANTAYERGGFSGGVMQLHTRGTDALNSKLLLDGSDRGVDTLATSDSSMVGKLHDDVPLGRHRVGAQSGDQRTNEQLADIVTERFDPIAPLRPGQVSTVKLHIDGLGTDPAQVKWTVGGAASVADGRDTATAPVKDGSCQLDIRAKQPGQLVIRTVLLVSIPEILGNLPPGGLRIQMPTEPPPTETPPLYTTEKPYGPGYRPPPCQPLIDGAFEPSQGVWQDDPKFDDHPTKQLSRPVSAAPDYLAGLDMISFRDTLLFGVDHYQDAKLGKVHAWYHKTMRFDVTSDCSDPPKGVFMRFTLERGSSPPGRVLYETPVLGQIPLTGHHVPPKQYTLFVDCTLGCPPPPAPPFRIAAFGEYMIQGELYSDDGKGTGLAVTVHGDVHGTYSIKIAYLALFLFPNDDAVKKAVDDESEQLGIMSGRYIPDYYPMQAHSIEGWALDPIDLSGTNIMNPTVERWAPPATAESIALHARFEREDRVRAEITRQLDALASLAGYQRFVLVLPKDDMIAIVGLHTVGYAFSKKIILVRSGEPYFTVAHELAHTLPYVWSSGEMNRDCKEPGDYHNQGVLWANGIRIDTAGVPGPRRFVDHDWTIMGGGDDNPDHTWIAQCTYWNLAKTLRKKPDPPALLVRGFASRSGGSASAVLWASYDVDGVLDVEARPATNDEHWAVVYLGADGRQLASYPFEPQWKDENGHEPALVPFALHVPRMMGVRTVELRGPDSLVLRQAVSTRAPIIRVLPPSQATRANGNTSVTLTWTATVQPGFKQLSTVLYSNDGGGSYHPRVFEASATTATVKIDAAAHQHRVKVIVTDGSQSTEQTLDFKT